MRAHIAEFEGKIYLLEHLFTEDKYVGRRENEVVVLKGKY